MKNLAFLFLLTTITHIPPGHEVVKWKLVQFRSLVFNCLDTVNVRSWHEEQMVTDSHFDLQGVRKEVLEESNGNATLYYLTKAGKVQKISGGTVSNKSFLLKDAVSGELYEEKTEDRTPAYLILSSKPGRLTIFFNEKYPPDSLSPKKIVKYIVESGRRFNKVIPNCK